MTEPASSTDVHTIHDFLPEPLRVGEPDVAGSLAVFPVFGSEPRQEYVSFSQGRERGVTITEREESASVRKLAVENPTETPVLFYEGEEVLGARQNRIFDVSILVAPASKLPIPVSCVERGRWESSRDRDELIPSPHSAYTRLRYLSSGSRARYLRWLLESPTAEPGGQAEVWADVAAKSSRHGSRSSTGAMSGVYESRRAELDEMRRSIPLRENQSGAIAAIGDHFLVLDYVSRPEVFAALHGPLVQGYSLDALEAEASEAPGIDAARGFALLVADCAVDSRTPSVGLGDEIRIASNGVTGSALVVDGELVQLTAFPGDERADGRIAARSRSLISTGV